MLQNRRTLSRTPRPLKACSVLIDAPYAAFNVFKGIVLGDGVRIAEYFMVGYVPGVFAGHARIVSIETTAIRDFVAVSYAPPFISTLKGKIDQVIWHRVPESF